MGLGMNKRGQNIIEYLLLVTAVAVVVIVFLSSNGPFRGALENSLNLVMVTHLTNIAQNVVLNTTIPP